MNDWIYPLSSASGYWFDHRAGRRTDTGVEALRDAIADKGEAWWHLSTAFRLVKPRDRVWCYYGIADGDLGVVALAVVGDTRFNPKTDGHEIRMDWQRAATRRLMKAPVPGPVVRKSVPRPRVAVMKIGQHEALMRRLRTAAGI